MRLLVLAAAVGLAALAARVAVAEPLLMGIGVSNITPDTEAMHVQLGGYGARQSAPATGVHDDLMCKAILLKQGDRTFALVATDQLAIARSLRDEVLARVESAGINSDNLLLTASHTHAAVAMNAMNRSNVFDNKAIGIFDEALLLFTAERIAEAILAANEHYREVQVGTASTMLKGLNRNRRNAPVVDRTLTVTRFDDMEGAPLAVHVNWTAHPTMASAETMVVTAGWPGFLQRNVEGFLPGAVCLYTNGSVGDITTAGASGPSEFARMEDYGRQLAKEVLALVENIETEPDATFNYATSRLELPEHEAPPALLEAAGPEYGLTPENLPILLEALGPDASYLQVLQVGGLTAMAIPGEITSELGLEIQEALRETGAEHPIIVGLSNDWISYILSPSEYNRGGYEPGMSFYGETLGPRVVNQAIEAGKALLATMTKTR